MTTPTDPSTHEPHRIPVVDNLDRAREHLDNLAAIAADAASLPGPWGIDAALDPDPHFDSTTLRIRARRYITATMGIADEHFARGGRALLEAEAAKLGRMIRAERDGHTPERVALMRLIVAAERVTTRGTPDVDRTELHDAIAAARAVLR